MNSVVNATFVLKEIVACLEDEQCDVTIFALKRSMVHRSKMPIVV